MHRISGFKTLLAAAAIVAVSATGAMAASPSFTCPDWQFSDDVSDAMVTFRRVAGSDLALSYRAQANIRAGQGRPDLPSQLSCAFGYHPGSIDSRGQPVPDSHGRYRVDVDCTVAVPGLAPIAERRPKTIAVPFAIAEGAELDWLPPAACYATGHALWKAGRLVRDRGGNL